MTNTSYDNALNVTGPFVLAGMASAEASVASIGSSSIVSARRLAARLTGGAFLCASVMLSATVAHADPAPYPAMTGALNPNNSPTTLDAGPLGKLEVTGVVSGIAQYQDPVSPGDHRTLGDITNGQVFIQKTDGLVQFFIEAGTYSLPDLGAPYMKATTATGGMYSALPQAFIKIVPSSSFSVMIGKLPTLIGAEDTFSFENLNVQRGLLWNQESAVSRGVQANYSKGPIALSVSLNDGYYSGKYDWLTGSLAYTLSKTDSLSLVGGGNFNESNRSSLATPITQNNGQIYNIIYTHTSGPWIIEPYIQYTSVPVSTVVGNTHSGSTLGGALLAKYTFSPKFLVSARGEYISSTGSLADGAPNLMYGPGSKAWSFTVTPTYQKGIFFLRGEFSYVGAWDVTPGMAMGAFSNSKSQKRVLLESGFVF